MRPVRKIREDMVRAAACTSIVDRDKTTQYGLDLWTKRMKIIRNFESTQRL
jgi:hypothetical protein